jgi:hypothetical protein
MKQSRMLNSTGDAGQDRAGQLAIHVFDFVNRATMEATMRAENMVQAIVIASHAAVASIHVLAKIVGRDSGDKPLTSTQVLFAALLAYHASPYEISLGHSTSEFSPIILNDALKDFEKLTGRQPDEELEQVMCETCREFASDPAKVAQINAEKAKAMSQVRTLN